MSDGLSEIALDEDGFARRMTAAKRYELDWKFTLRLGLVIGWLSATGFWALAHYFGGLWNG